MNSFDRQVNFVHAVLAFRSRCLCRAAVQIKPHEVEDSAAKVRAARPLRWEAWRTFQAPQVVA